MYNLQLQNITEKINKEKAKKVLIQLPDGLKPEAEKITNYLEEHTKSQIFIWLGDCFGACDLPLNLTQLQIDLVIQFGHNQFCKGEW